MNNSVLNLLFNFNGTLSRKSYCATVILLFVIAGIVTSKVSASLFSTLYVNFYFGISSQITDSIYKSLAWIFTPAFIPIYFVGFYSAVVITIKRARALKLSNIITAALVIINSLFFNIFFKIQEISQYAGLSTRGVEEIGVEINLIQPKTIYVFLFVFFVLGLIVNLYFMLNRQGDDDHSLTKEQLQNMKQENSYNQLSYIFYVGKLMLINFGIIIVLVISAFIFREALSELLYEDRVVKILLVLGMIYFGIFLGLFLHATAKRLNDAGYKTYLLVLYFIFFVIFCLLFGYVANLKTQLSLILVSLSSLFVTFFSAAQMIPFLLKSKDENN